MLRQAGEEDGILGPGLLIPFPLENGPGTPLDAEAPGRSFSGNLN